MRLPLPAALTLAAVASAGRLSRAAAADRGWSELDTVAARVTQALLPADSRQAFAGKSAFRYNSRIANLQAYLSREKLDPAPLRQFNIS
eukprot:SAG31_NODE_720_length_12587_cov_15.393114_7_plen_89_part_00